MRSFTVYFQVLSLPVKRLYLKNGDNGKHNEDDDDFQCRH